MYKAGDFTNGKMNKIFKEATTLNQEKRSIRKACISGPIITHKQLGDFALIDKELFAVKSAIIYEAITGISIEDFYKLHGDGGEEANKNQLKAINEILFPTGYDELIDWNDAYFALADRLAVITCIQGRNDCKEYMKQFKGAVKEVENDK